MHYQWQHATSGFLLILTITGSDFNIEYLITNIAMTTQMQKNLKNEGIMIAK